MSIEKDILRLKRSICCINSTLFFDNFAAFPPTGKENTIYVDKALAASYYWDGATYVPFAGGGGSPTTINNTLVSTSTTEALSANQGKVLQDTKVNKPTLLADAGKILAVNAAGNDVEYINAPSVQTVEYVFAKISSDAAVNNGQPFPMVTVEGNITNVSGVFTLQAGKTYSLQGKVAKTTADGTNGFAFAWRNITSGLIIGATGQAVPPGSGTSEAASNLATAIITPTVTTTVRLENTEGGTRTAIGTQTSVSIIQIASPALPLAQIVDYVNVYATTTMSPPTDTALVFNTNLSGNIPYNTTTGVFTLTAGKTYRLTSNVVITQSGIASTVAWYNQTASTFISPGAVQTPADSIGNTSSNQAEVIFTPAVTTLVYLRNASGGSRNFIGQGLGVGISSSATIVQVGASAITTQTRAAFRALNTSGQTITSNTNTVINGWTEIFDTTSSFNPTTGVFIAPRAGLYQFNGGWMNLGYTPSAIGDDFRVQIIVNGIVAASALVDTQNTTGTVNLNPTVSTVVNLNLGDTVSLRAFQTSSLARTLTTADGGVYNHFSVIELSPTF